MAAWLVKSDPDEYSAHDLERDGRTAWSGVRNPTAQQHLRAMAEGDEVLVYHTGDEREIVALARVAAAPYPEPGGPNERTVCVDLEFVRFLKTPIPLAAIKSDPAFSEFPLVRIGRLSVMPVKPDEWRGLLTLAGERGRTKK